MTSRGTPTPSNGVTPVKWHDTPSGINATSASKVWEAASLGEFSMKPRETLFSTACRPMHAGVSLVRQRRLPSITF
jgi:hypothetical protein